MCGRFAVVEPVPEIARLFGFDAASLPPSEPGRARFNIAPTTPVLGVAAPDGERVGLWLRWGLVPAWARDMALGARMFNARSEGVESRSAYKAAFARRRCLVPASAFYEWAPPAAGGGPRRPYAFRMPDRSPFALAGIWEENTVAAAGRTLRTLSILTTAASQPVSSLHDRMPVIVAAGDYGLWLAPDAPAADVRALCRPAADGTLVSYAVTPKMNRAAFDDPDCLVPVEA